LPQKRVKSPERIRHRRLTSSLINVTHCRSLSRNQSANCAERQEIEPTREIAGMLANSHERKIEIKVKIALGATDGRGFGMRKQNLPTDHWIDRFAGWLELQW
jgi:hypothetical protein